MMQTRAYALQAPDWMVQATGLTILAMASMTLTSTLSQLQTQPPRPGVQAAASRIPAPTPRLAPAPPPPPLIAFAQPVADYPVISPFGLRQLPWEAHGRLHAGVDIAAPPGVPIRAVADGVVTRAGVDGGYGRFVEVRHAGGLTSLYAHLGAARARPGALVKQGQVIAAIGSTGSSTGAHLHLEIHDRKGRPLNPEMFLGRSFATAGALPLKAAARAPRRVRVAFVSFIPASKRALMAAREEEKTAAQTSLQAAASVPVPPPAPTATPAYRIPMPGPAAGRVHARLQMDS